MNWFTGSLDTIILTPSLHTQQKQNMSRSPPRSVLSFCLINIQNESVKIVLPDDEIINYISLMIRSGL